MLFMVYNVWLLLHDDYLVVGLELLPASLLAVIQYQAHPRININVDIFWTNCSFNGSRGVCWFIITLVAAAVGTSVCFDGWRTFRIILESGFRRNL